MMATAAPLVSLDAEATVTLGYGELQPIIAEATSRWTETRVEAADAFDRVIFRIADLPGLMLGQTIGNTVWIDSSAAGYGWFIDLTPSDESEFEEGKDDGEWKAATASDVYGHMDLLTVVTHELGHILGLEDLNPNTGDLMGGTLDTGERRLTGDATDPQSEDGSNHSVVAEPSGADDPLATSMQSGQNPWLLVSLRTQVSMATIPRIPTRRSRS
jgi:hypothetical protein